MRAAMLVLAAWLASTTLVFAAPITWRFEGQVAAIRDSSPQALAQLSSLGVDVGSSFAGQIVFDSEVPDSSPDPGYGYFSNAILSVQVAIGSYESSFLLGGAFNEIASAGTYLAMLGSGSGGANILESPLLGFELLSVAPRASAAMPLVPPDLATLLPFDPTYSNPDNGYASHFFAKGSDASIIGELSSLVLVPEPGARALVGVVLGGAVALRRRRRS